MDSDPAIRLRALPPAHLVLATEEARVLEGETSREAVRELVRGVLEALRDELVEGRAPAERGVLLARARGALVRASARARTPRLRRVINATGVVLHTNLGRAPLGDDALSGVAEAVRGYAALEYDLERGERGHRDAVLAPFVAGVLGAEDALVVNNNAAAVLLTATALAAGREVVVSRGELVEIGGGFRVPEILEACGAKLVEVGTTNRTRREDYERAITPATALLLKVHRSNFAMVGFTEEVSVRDLSALGRARGVAVVEDLGSGALTDLARYGLPHEPTPRESVEAGADLVMVSGDKLLGGPQAGIVAGRRALVGELRRHPLARALRPGRLVLSALEATLRAYAEGREARDVPVVAMLATTGAELRERALALVEGLRSRGVRGEVVQTEGKVGGGALPLATLGSWGVRVAGRSAAGLEDALRRAEPPVVARIVEGAVVLDVRTVAPWELEAAARSVVAAVAMEAARSGDGASPGAGGHEGDR